VGIRWHRREKRGIGGHQVTQEGEKGDRWASGERNGGDRWASGGTGGRNEGYVGIRREKWGDWVAASGG
jgi:hypothetical protein